jgi:hypothetical protein
VKFLGLRGKLGGQRSCKLMIGVGRRSRRRRIALQSSLHATPLSTCPSEDFWLPQRNTSLPRCNIESCDQLRAMKLSNALSAWSASFLGGSGSDYALGGRREEDPCFK